jgi:hypothetical protein
MFGDALILNNNLFNCTRNPGHILFNGNFFIIRQIIKWRDTNSPTFALHLKFR